MNNRLEQSVIAAQRSAPQTNERDVAFAALADEILRARRICRPSANCPLSGIFLEIYQAARQHLKQQLEAQIDRARPPSVSLREWVENLRDLALKSVLSDDRLQAIALHAQRASTPEQRQYALRELVEAIRISDRLCRPHRGKFNPQFYELLYEEAVNQTLVYVCQNIDKYDPERSRKFMTWVNFRLDKLVIESRWDFSFSNVQELPSLEDLEAPIEEDSNDVRLALELEKFIQQDEKNIFKKEHIRDRPDANFQTIALATLQGKTWEELSQELKIKVPTLSSFFRRCCQKFSPHFKARFGDRC